MIIQAIIRAIRLLQRRDLIMKHFFRACAALLLLCLPAMSLAATALGVGCCYIWGAVVALSSRPELVKALGLPEGFVPCCGLVLGQSEEGYAPREIPQNRIGVNYVG